MKTLIAIDLIILTIGTILMFVDEVIGGILIGVSVVLGFVVLLAREDENDDQTATQEKSGSQENGEEGK